MSNKRIATIGDVHGCLDELQTLYKRLEWESLDEIRHSGDLVDRGPDSGGVVAFCREHKMPGVMGNHESVILNHIKRGMVSKNPDKAGTQQQLTNPLDVEYLSNLPILHVDDESKVVYVHGGLLPGKNLYEQVPENIIRLQMINPAFPGKVKWFSEDRDGVSEAENRKNGWVRWYEVYDGYYDVIYGHTVYQHGVYVYQVPGFGRSIGVDTGCVWSGQLSAVVMPDLKVIQTPITREFTKWHDIHDDSRGRFLLDTSCANK